MPSASVRIISRLFFVIFAVVTVVFFIQRMIPATPADAVLGADAPMLQKQEWLRRNGFDRPLAQQYIEYLGGMAQGDFGRRLVDGRPIAPQLSTVIFALCAGGWIVTAKIVRAQFRALKSADFVVAARALGATPLRIIFKHLLPAVVSLLTVHSTFTMAGAILAEAGLSFLGLGLGDGHVSWGGLLSEARAYLIESPHMAIFPSLSMLSLVLSLHFLGEALRVALDPRQSPLSGGA